MALFLRYAYYVLITITLIDVLCFILYDPGSHHITNTNVYFCP